ncbi:putative GBF-interacting protein [Helianthus annuus]|nr:putative GBF-interacting protein [Helianthus annuus]
MSNKMNSGVKVSIPNNVRKTIQNIKEITGSHSEDEIYAMLKDCSMDPNETAQKLLLQDPFHEVRRKRDRKKEPNVVKESTETRWKPGMQGRGSRGGRGNYSSRHNSHDAGSNKNAPSGKESEINHVADDGVILPAPQNKKSKEITVVPSSCIVAEKSSTIPASGVNESEVKILTAALGDLSASDSVLMPSQDSQLPVGTISLEVGSQQTPLEKVNEDFVEIESKTASVLDVGSSFMQGKMFQGDGPHNRPQQVIGPHKVAPVKEWKPKPTNPIPAQALVTEVPAIPISVPVEAPPSSTTESVIPESKESRIPDGQQVIIPNHLHVPEAEKLGFCFGSFDASFGLNSNTFSGPGGPGPMIDENRSISEASEETTEHIEEQTNRDQDVLATADDGDNLDRPPSSVDVPENVSPEGDVSSNMGPEHAESKQETSLPVPGHQYPVVHPSSNISFGFIPPIIGNHLPPFESNESQPRDTSRVPTFVVPQPFDPVGYYPQFYRSGGDSDGRISPFHTPKYNGNVPVLSQQTSQSTQEVGNALMLSGAGPTPLASQPGGVMLSSIAVTQQPLPVFRQPPGLHLPHYPPNYIPYGPYFFPHYLPPPAIHQFLSNGAFPQQPPAGGMHPAPPVSTPKYPLQQYKPGSNGSNPGTYGPYGSNPAGYNLNSAVTAGNSTSNEDLGGSQFKENNVYATGQQSEGSGVWIAAPGRDISGMQANSFYNLPQGGQVAYTPTQAAHATFASIYQPVTTTPIHPLLQQPQTMAGGVDMVGPASTVYQQPPQPPQINWPNNY